MLFIYECVTAVCRTLWNAALWKRNEPRIKHKMNYLNCCCGTKHTTFRSENAVTVRFGRLMARLLPPAAPEHMLCLQNGRFDHADRMFNRYLQTLQHTNIQLLKTLVYNDVHFWVQCWWDVEELFRGRHWFQRGECFTNAVSFIDHTAVLS